MQLKGELEEIGSWRRERRVLTLRLLMSYIYIYIYIYIQAARLLRSWVRIPPGAWIFVCCECRVLWGSGLCDELITRPVESYRLCCVVVCDLETSRIGAPYVYDISNLRVKYYILNIASFVSSPQYIYAFHVVLNAKKNHYFCVKMQRDSKRWTQFRTSIFPELYMVCEWST